MACKKVLKQKSLEPPRQGWRRRLGPCLALCTTGALRARGWGAEHGVWHTQACFDAFPSGCFTASNISAVTLQCIQPWPFPWGKFIGMESLGQRWYAFKGFDLGHHIALWKGLGLPSCRLHMGASFSPILCQCWAFVLNKQGQTYQNGLPFSVQLNCRPHKSKDHTLFTRHCIHKGVHTLKAQRFVCHSRTLGLWRHACGQNTWHSSSWVTFFSVAPFQYDLQTWQMTATSLFTTTGSWAATSSTFAMLVWPWVHACPCTWPLSSMSLA